MKSPLLGASAIASVCAYCCFRGRADVGAAIGRITFAQVTGGTASSDDHDLVQGFAENEARQAGDTIQRVLGMLRQGVRRPTPRAGRDRRRSP